jgi:hypothetical protein
LKGDNSWRSNSSREAKPVSEFANHLSLPDHALDLQKRQSQGYIFDKVLAKSHKSKLDLSNNFKTADWSLLGQNKSIVLHPETTEGPYC